MSEHRTVSTNELQRMAGRLRADSSALLVVVIRVDDVAFSVDPAISPEDAGITIKAELPAFVQHLAESRKRG